MFLTAKNLFVIESTTSDGISIVIDQKLYSSFTLFINQRLLLLTSNIRGIHKGLTHDITYNRMKITVSIGLW